MTGDKERWQGAMAEGGGRDRGVVAGVGTGDKGQEGGGSSVVGAAGGLSRGRGEGVGRDVWAIGSDPTVDTKIAYDVLLKGVAYHIIIIYIYTNYVYILHLGQLARIISRAIVVYDNLYNKSKLHA